MSQIVPTHYTTVEGGEWKEWGFLLAPSLDYLDAIAKLKAARFMWHGVTIHSLAFHNPIGTPMNGFARWDCVSGWTTTIEDVETMNDGV